MEEEQIEKKEQQSDDAAPAPTFATIPPEKKKSKARLALILGIVGALVVTACVIAILFATHVLCIHEWQAATCTEPEICSICNRTQGEPLGHQVTKWRTTIEPTCTSVGEQVGNCDRCGERLSEELAMLPHTEGAWETTRDWMLNSAGNVEAGEQVVKCTVCGTLLQTKELIPELTTAEEGACKFAMQLLFSDTGVSRDFLIQQLESQGFTNAEATLAADHSGADWNEEAVKSAKFYLQTSGGSRSMVMEWLRLEHFTDEQMNYACDQVGL